MNIKHLHVELGVPLGMDFLIGSGGSWRGDGAEDGDLEQSGRRMKQKQSGVSLKGKESFSAEEVDVSDAL